MVKGEWSKRGEDGRGVWGDGRGVWGDGRGKLCHY
jgi:hypothetical protein